MNNPVRAYGEWLALILYAVVLGAVGVWRVWLMVPAEFDLGYQVWAIYQVGAEGFDAVVPWAGISVAGNHLSLLIPALAPFRNLHSLPVMLTVLQVIAVASAVAIVLRTAASRHTRVVAALIAAGAALHPATLYAALWDVHMNVLGLPLIVAFLFFVASDRPMPALAFGLLSGGVREDIALVVVVVALVNRRRLGRAVTSILVVAGLAVPVIWATAGGNTGAVSIFGFVDPSDPSGSVVQALTNLAQGGYVVSLAMLLALPWLFLPRPDWRIALPTVLPHAALLFSDTPVTRSIGFHYYVVPIFAVALAIAVRTPAVGEERTRPPLIAESTRRVGAALTIGVLFVVGPLATSAVSREYTRNSVVGIRDGYGSQLELASDMRDALRCVEPHQSGAVLAVEGEYVPWLAGADLRVLPHPFEDYRFASGRSDVVLREAETVLPGALLVSPSTPIPNGYVQDSAARLVFWHDDVTTRCESLFD